MRNVFCFSAIPVQEPATHSSFVNRIAHFFSVDIGVNNRLDTIERSTMHGALKNNFAVFQCVGLWRPIHWLPGWKTKLYDLYTIFMIFLISTVTISEFIDLLGTIDDVDAFADNSFILMTMVSICGKGANILKKRGELIGLVNVLDNYPCQPYTTEETTIQRKFDQLTRSDMD